MDELEAIEHRIKDHKLRISEYTRLLKQEEQKRLAYISGEVKVEYTQWVLATELEPVLRRAINSSSESVRQVAINTGVSFTNLKDIMRKNQKKVQFDTADKLLTYFGIGTMLGNEIQVIEIPLKPKSKCEDD